MIAIDTDIASDLYLGDANVIQRLRAYPRTEIALPIIVVEEILRGRLSYIRKHQASRDADKLAHSYRMLQLSTLFFQGSTLLQYSPLAEQYVRNWCQSKIRVGTQDMRIAAICIDLNCSLLTRNQRDFAQLPGLILETWN